MALEGFFNIFKAKVSTLPVYYEYCRDLHKGYMRHVSNMLE